MPVKPPQITVLEELPATTSLRRAVGIGRRPPVYSVDGRLLSEAAPATVYPRGIDLSRSSTRLERLAELEPARIGKRVTTDLPPAARMRHHAAPPLLLRRGPHLSRSARNLPASLATTAEASQSLLCTPGLLSKETWTPCNPGGGGNVHTLMFHPACSSVLFVGSDNGGLYRGVLLSHSTAGTKTWTFEPFHQGLHSLDIKSMAASESAPDDFFFCLTGRTMAPEHSRLLYRWRPTDRRWHRVSTHPWTWTEKQSAPNSQGEDPFSKILVAPLERTDKRLAILVSGNVWEVERDSTSPRYGRIALGHNSAAKTATGVPLYWAPAVHAAVVNLDHAAEPHWYGNAIGHEPNDPRRWRLRAGIGSFWIGKIEAPSANTVRITAYLTVAICRPKTTKRTPDPCLEASTRLVRCTLTVLPDANTVSEIRFDAPLLLPGSPSDTPLEQLLGAAGLPYAALELGQVAGRASGHGIELFTSIVRSKTSSAGSPDYPCVLRIRLPDAITGAGWTIDSPIGPGRSLRESEVREATSLPANSPASNLVYVQSSPNGGVVAAPAQSALFASSQSPQLWYLPPSATGSGWFQALYPFEYATGTASLRFARCFRAVLPRTLLD